jgi:S1-C subfamily serine protease
MRTTLSFALLCLNLLVLAGLSLAEDLVTSDGRTFKGVRVLKEEADKIKISHSDGISSIPKKMVPAEFFQAHELTAPPEDAAMDAKVEMQAKMKLFADQFPTFTTKDGREFKTSEITAIEPNGLKLMAASGIVRIRFLDIPEKYKTALGYDPMAAAEYERAQEAAQAESQEMRQKMSNAASIVDAISSRVRLVLIQNVGKGWMCSGSLLRTVEEEQITSRPGSPLSGPAVIYEKRNVSKTVVVGELDQLIVFGLPIYGSSTVNDSKRVWEGTIYNMGKYEFNTTGGERLTIEAFHTDRNASLNFVAKHGVGQLVSAQGEQVVAAGSGGVLVGNGTGFAISEDGYIATAYHVVDDATDIQVYVGKKPISAKVVARDRRNDLAILKVDAETQPLPVSDKEPESLGQQLFTIGFPLLDQLGAKPKYTQGSVSGLDGGIYNEKGAFQFSIPIQPGNSGGPVCAEDGTVLGVVASTISTLASGVQNNAVPQNVNFATKSSMLRKLIKTRPEIKTVESLESSDAQAAVVKATYLIMVSSKKG